MEVITLTFDSSINDVESRIDEVKNFTKNNILSKENIAVLIGSGDRRNKFFSILALNNITKPLQWDKGRIFRYQTEEGKEKLTMDYFFKLPTVFVFKQSGLN